MTTVGTMLDRIRRELLGSHRPQLNMIASDTDALSGTSTWTFSYDLAAIAYTAWLAVGDEIVYVLSSDRTNRTAVVWRGQLGTVPAVHTAGSVVEVNARFPRAQILDSMLAEVVSWPSTVYRVATLDLTTSEGVRGYDLTGLAPDFIDVVKVLRSPDVWIGESSNNSWPDVAYRVERNLPTGTFQSGAAIFFDRAYKAASSVRVIASRPFGTAGWSETTSLENDVGLPVSLFDALQFGVMWRLLAGKEIARTDTSANADSRSDQAVPVLGTTQAAGALLKLRDRRLADEAVRLMALYGTA